MSSSSNNSSSNNTSTTAGGGVARAGVVDVAGSQQRQSPQHRPRRAALGSGLGTFFEEFLPDEVRRRAHLAAAGAGGGGGDDNDNDTSIPYDVRVDQLEGLNNHLTTTTTATMATAARRNNETTTTTTTTTMLVSSSSMSSLLGCETSNQRWSSNQDLPLKRKQTLVEYARRRMNFTTSPSSTKSVSGGGGGGGGGSGGGSDDDDDDDGDDDDDAAEEDTATGGEELSQQHQKKSTMEDDDGDDDEEEEDDEEMMCETQPPLDTFESQPMDPEDGNSDGKDGEEDGNSANNKNKSKCKSKSKSSSSIKKKKKKRHHQNKIQPVDETTFDVTDLEHVNLKTRNLTITGPESQSLCRVLTLWPIRSTGRFSPIDGDDEDEEEQQQHGDDRPNDFAEIFPSQNHNALPRYSHRHGQDDGPAAVGHKYVLSLEVEQRFFNTTTTTTTATTTLPPASSHQEEHHSSRKRMVVFLYDEYAWMVHDWLQQQNGKAGKSSSSSWSWSSSAAEYIMDFSTLPAKCIFPYAIDPRSWFDRASLLEYCLCIAPVNSVYKEICASASASSAASVDHSDGPDEEKVRLDSADMRVRIASVTSDSTIAPATMSAENNKQLVLTRETTSEYVRRQDLVDGPSTKRRRTAQEQNASDGDQDDEDTTLQDVWLAQQPGHHHHQQQQQQQQEEEDEDEDFGSYEPFHDDGDSTAPSPEPIIFEGQATRNSVYPQGQRCEYKSLKDLKTLMDDYRKNNLNGGRGVGTEISPFVVNVYAVVRNFTIPRRPNGLDWYAKLDLIDETTSSANDDNDNDDDNDEKVEHITLVAFRREQELLPKIFSVGDVIRIHRARLQSFNGTQLQLLIRGRNEYNGSCVVLRKDGHRWKAAATAKKTFTFDNSDALKMQSLWNWGHDHSMKKPIINSEHKFSIGDIPSMEIDGTLNSSVKDKDTVVMVTGMYPNPNFHLPSVYGFLRIWDGTGDDCDQFLVDSLFTQEMKRRNEPTSDAVEKVASLVDKNHYDDSSGSSDSALSIEIPRSLCGRVTNAAIWEKELWEFCQQNLNVGTFVMLRNVDINGHPRPEIPTINIHNRSWLVPLPDRSFDVKQLLRAHNGRIPEQYNPRAALLPLHSPYHPDTASRRGDSSNSDPLTVSSFSSFKQSVDADANFSGTVQLDTLRRHGNKYVVGMSDIIGGGSITAFAADSSSEEDRVKEFIQNNRIPDGSTVALDGVTANVVLVGLDVSGARFFILQSIRLSEGQS